MDNAAPFILACGFLYYGLALPVWFTSQLSQIPNWAEPVLRALVATQWVGFGVAALADLTKTYVKKSEGDENYLVTSGIFSFIRHPNYAGEILGWTCNFIAGILAAGLWIPNLPSISWTVVSSLATMTVSWVGILFVLLRATNSLENRQAKAYATGDSATKYKAWVLSTWGGWQLPAKAEEHETPKIEMDKTLEEDSGSGI